MFATGELVMASVHKPRTRNSKYWIACYTLPSGKRKQVSTGCTDKAAAQHVALRLETASSLARSGQLTDSKVGQLLREIKQDAGTSLEARAITVGQYLESWMTASKSAWSQSTFSRNQNYIDSFIHFLQKGAVTPISDVEPDTIIAFRLHELERGLSARTVKNCMKFLKGAWAEAVEHGYIHGSPWEKVSAPKVKKAASPKQPFTRVQFAQLLSVVSGEWRLLFLIAYYTGQRQRDCRELRKEQIDFSRHLIRFQRRKNADALEVPMHRRLEKHLRWWLYHNNDTDCLMPEIAKIPSTGGQKSFPEIFRYQVLPKIGIVQPPNKSTGTAGRRATAYSFHSFRHSLVTELNRAGASEVDRMGIVGHASRDVSRSYTHAEVEHALSVLNRV